MVSQLDLRFGPSTWHTLGMDERRERQREGRAQLHIPFCDLLLPSSPSPCSASILRLVFYPFISGMSDVEVDLGVHSSGNSHPIVVQTNHLSYHVSVPDKSQPRRFGGLLSRPTKFRKFWRM